MRTTGEDGDNEEPTARQDRLETEAAPVDEETTDPEVHEDHKGHKDHKDPEVRQDPEARQDLPGIQGDQRMTPLEVVPPLRRKSKLPTSRSSMAPRKRS